MSEFDDLIKVRGVMIAGRFGPGWSLEEYKTESLFIEQPRAMAVLGSFCAAIQSMFTALSASLVGLTADRWTHMHSWTASAGDYTIGLVGSRFVIVVTSQFGHGGDVCGLLEAPDAAKDS